MIRSSYALVGALAVALSLGACGDDDGGGGDACEGLIQCSAEGTSCAGDTIVTCAPNADGCLLTTVVEDCATSNATCSDSGTAPMCLGCSDDAACAGMSDGDSFCTDDTAVTCNANAAGCLIATDDDCGAVGRICDTVSGDAGCFDDCTDDVRCTGGSAGDTSCDTDDLLTCTVVPGGCLVASVHNCGIFGGTCTDTASPAVCTPGVCSDHALCAGRSDGDSFCDGDFLNTCNTGGDGCLDLTQVGCGPGTCDATGTPVCTTPTETGEDCANAYVITNTTTFSHADITAYADDLTFTDASCQMRPTVSDIVFQVDLLDGETVDVAEFGGADTVINFQVGTCGQGLACVSNQDDPDTAPQSYTATGAQTVYITMESYFDMPDPTDVSITISIDRSCGNGIVEPGEACDDGGNSPLDGCSPTCTFEFGYECDVYSPSTCTQIPSIGTFDAAEPISNVVNPGNLPGAFRESFLITFNEPVQLSGTLTVPGTGDPDFFLVDSFGRAVINSAAEGAETFSGFVPAGTYTIIIDIYGPTGAADQGYVLTLSTQSILDGGTIGAGGTSALSGGNLPAGASDYYTLTVTEDILLTFDLTSDDGASSDMDLVIHGADGFVTAVADDFNESGVSIALYAGTYVFEFNAYAETAAATVWNFSATSTALSLTSIGSFAAGATITDTVGGAITERMYDHYEITFTEDVLLSGTLGGNTTGAVGVYIYDASRNYLASFGAGDEAFTDVPLDAGSYIVEILTVSATFGGGNVDAYTLSLSSSAP